MSQTLEELEQIIKETHDKIEEVEAQERIAALELEYLEITEDIRLEAEAQEFYEEEAREAAEEARPKERRIAKSIEKLCEALEEPIILPEDIPVPKTPRFTVDKTAFNHVVSQVSTLVEEATFEVNSEGITFRSMDPSHVALIDVTLPKECFATFEENIKPSKFGVRIDELVKVLRNFDRKETLTVFIGEDSMLHLEGTSFKTTLRLIESSASSVPLPKLQFDAEIDLSINTLKKLKGIQTVSDYISIEYDHPTGSLTASGKGDSGEAEFSITDYEIRYSTRTSSAKAIYSLDYLVKFLNKIITDIKGSVRFAYSTKHPVKLSYKVLEYGRVEFYLAPRVQD